MLNSLNHELLVSPLLVKRDILLHLHVIVQIFVSVNVLSALWGRLEDTVVKVRKID